MVHLHQQLSSEASPDERKSLREKTFDELSLSVTEHATKLVSNMRWMGEKVRGVPIRKICHCYFHELFLVLFRSSTSR